MKKKLFLNRIEIRKSSIHGWGVFAKESIGKGELIEECLCATIEYPIIGTIAKYNYSWPKQEDCKLGDARDRSKRKVVFGFAAIYNCAKTKKSENIDWYTDRDIYIFKAVKDIKKNEELCIYYGDYFWEWYNSKEKNKKI